MISHSYIVANLKQLNYAYDSAKYKMYPLYFAKLALLELCGWIELSMDDIIRMHAKRRRLGKDHTRYLEDSVISRTHGFDYDRHFRSMLVRLLGVIDLQQLEKTVDPVLSAKLRANLRSLTTSRNTLAHSYVKGTTMSIDAPSLTLARFSEICSGLREYESKIGAL
jgi:hypothetical protein